MHIALRKLANSETIVAHPNFGRFKNLLGGGDILRMSPDVFATLVLGNRAADPTGEEAGLFAMTVPIHVMGLELEIAGETRILRENDVIDYAADLIPTRLGIGESFTGAYSGEENVFVKLDRSGYKDASIERSLGHMSNKPMGVLNLDHTFGRFDMVLIEPLTKDFIGSGDRHLLMYRIFGINPARIKQIQVAAFTKPSSWSNPRMCEFEPSDVSQVRLNWDSVKQGLLPV